MGFALAVFALKCDCIIVISVLVWVIELII